MNHAPIFEKLGPLLQADTQRYIDNFPQEKGFDEPVVAFCFYFDSENGSITSLLLPVSVYEIDHDVSDIAAWGYHKGYQLDGAQSEEITTLFEEYNEVYFADANTKKMCQQLREQFVAMMMVVLKNLSFEKLNKHPDFIYFAEAMDEDYNLIRKTVNRKLYKKHFG